MKIIKIKNLNKPSVSELIGLLNKPNLITWANKQGLKGIDIRDKNSKSQKEGTSLHKQIADYLLNGTPFENPEYQERCDAFFADKKVLSVEKECENEHFIGRYDIKLEYKNQVYLCDFKLNNKTIYFDHELQLVAYKMLSGADSIAIISIPDFKFKILQIKHYEVYESILINLANIYKSKVLLNLK